MHIYHWVPRNLEGSVLYPLNRLKETHPHLYEQHVLKYETRPQLPRLRIPPLDCLWNDVLFLSPVHPRLIGDALTDTGFSVDATFRFFEIEARVLDPRITTVFTEPDRYDAYELRTLGAYASLPASTVAYYKAAHAAKSDLHVFNHIPHILYKGWIDIEKAPIIER